MGFWLRWTARLATAALGIGAAPLGAQQTPATPHWQMDWGDRLCSLIRHPAAEQPAFALRTLPGSRTWQLSVARPSWPAGLLSDRAGLIFRLHPGGEPLSALYMLSSETPAGQAIVLDSADATVLETLAAAQRLTIEWRGEIVADVPLENVRAGVAAFRQCENQVMREWGIDPTLYARLRSLPRINLGALFRDRDYPAEALRQGLSGESTVRVTIDAHGQVSGCALAVSSGHPVLDQQTCDVLRERVRTEPALDSNGVPTSVPLVTTIRWRLY